MNRGAFILALAVLLALPAQAQSPWRKYMGLNAGISTDGWRETLRGDYPLVIGNASITNSIDPARLDALLADNDWINLQDGYNYRQEAAVNAFFDAVRADGGALWRSNCAQLAQAMVDGNARNAATGHRSYWELGNEIFAGIAGQTIGAWITNNNLPYPHPNSPYNDNPAHIERINDRGIIGYQVEYQIALALEALIAVNAAAPAAHRVKILSPCSTVSSINGGWTQALLDYVIVGYEVEKDANGNAFTNYAKPLASSLAGQRLRDLVDLVNVHYILGPYGTTLNTVFDAHVTPGSAIRGVWHTEELGINAANSGRGGLSVMSSFPRAMDVWLTRGLTPADARLVYYAANTGPAGTRGDDALDLLHAFMPGDTTVLTRKPGLLSSGSLVLESYTFENADGSKRALFILPGNNSTVSFSNLTMQADGWNWTNVTGTARLWAANVVPAANNVTVTRATNGGSYTLTFPQATFTGQNLQALVIFLTGSGLPLEISISGLPAGGVAQGYAQTLTATGGTGPYSWTVISGSLPQGLTLATNGHLHGSPEAAGFHSFTVQVTDALGATATRAFQLVVFPDPVPPVVSILPGGNAHLLWPFTSGFAYQVEFSPDLDQWFVIGQPPVVNGSTMEWTDNGSATGTPPAGAGRRFYRLRISVP